MIFLIDHCDSLFGASRYLYYLFSFLKKKYRVFLVTPNQEKYSKNCHFLHYNNDISILQQLLEYHQPAIIYINSWNPIFINLHYPRSKIIYHSHEAFSGYYFQSLVIPDFVVSKKISHQYYNFNATTPKIQSPFILLEVMNHIFEQAQIPISLPHSMKINIGMCGEVSNRKNFDKFVQLARLFPQYNFIWIGKRTKDVHFSQDNFIFIEYTSNPYQYYYQYVDYFLLTSEMDPCPFVVLENILLETPLILFKKSILTEYPDCPFISWNSDSFSIKNGIKAIFTFVKVKKKPIQKLGQGRDYINQYFGYPLNVFLEIEKKLKTPTTN